VASEPNQLRGVHSLASLPGLQQPTDFVNLSADGSGEPVPRQKIVDPTQRPVAQIEFFDMMNPGPTIDGSDFEPGVKIAWNTMLNDDIDATRPLPGVAGDDRPFEPAEEFAIFPSDHPVW
jgi:hypothetical protein